MPTDPPIGWYSRGYQPHLNTPRLLQFVTFHLADSLPRPTLLRLMAETEDNDAERRRRLERLLDAGHGACWLRRPEIGRLVEDALLKDDGVSYRLLAWVVMPNHVHALIETGAEVPLPMLVRGWKGSTARATNLLLKRSGSFWHRDYFDRYIRDDAHLAAVLRYIARNPVKAGLVSQPQDWPFGSARFSQGSAD